MNEIAELKRWILGCQDSYNKRIVKLQEGIEKTKQKRQEQTEKPYRQKQ